MIWTKFVSPIIGYPAKILDMFRIKTESACSTKCIDIRYLAYQLSDHVSFLDIRNVIPTQLTIVVLDLDFITLDTDNSEIHLILRHETLTCVVSYQYKTSNIVVWFLDRLLAFNDAFSGHSQVVDLCLKNIRH